MIKPLIALVTVTGLGYLYEKFIAKTVGSTPAKPTTAGAKPPATPANPNPSAPSTASPSTAPVVAALSAAQSAAPAQLGGGVTETFGADGQDTLSGGDIGSGLTNALDNLSGDATGSLTATSSGTSNDVSDASDLSTAIDALGF
jgi:hypothetical protein